MSDELYELDAKVRRAEERGQLRREGWHMCVSLMAVSDELYELDAKVRRAEERGQLRREG